MSNEKWDRKLTKVALKHFGKLSEDLGITDQMKLNMNFCPKICAPLPNITYTVFYTNIFLKKLRRRLYILTITKGLGKLMLIYYTFVIISLL